MGPWVTAIAPILLGLAAFEGWVRPLLVAVAFWTWLWGAPGVLMATPLTVCLVVMANRVPALDRLVTIMRDAPGLSADVSY